MSFLKKKRIVVGISGLLLLVIATALLTTHLLTQVPQDTRTRADEVAQDLLEAPPFDESTYETIPPLPDVEIPTPAEEEGVVQMAAVASSFYYSGKVSDTVSNPVFGATVYVSGNGKNYSQVTNSGGGFGFILPAGDYSSNAWKQNYYFSGTQYFKLSSAVTRYFTLSKIPPAIPTATRVPATATRIPPTNVPTPTKINVQVTLTPTPRPRISISGGVWEKGGDKIANASITIDNGAAGTTANDAGYYGITTYGMGNHTFIISAKGYITQKQTVSVTSTAPTINFFLIRTEPSPTKTPVVTTKSPTATTKPECYTVRGIVFEDKNKDGAIQQGPEPSIGGATVDLIYGSSVVFSTVTTQYGIFTIPCRKGEYTLRTTMSGYRTYARSISIYSDLLQVTLPMNAAPSPTLLQKITVYGGIYEKGGGAINTATVSVDGNTSSVAVSDTGIYSIQVSGKGNHTFTVSAPNYVTQLATKNITDNTSSPINYYLIKADTTTQPTIVKSSPTKAVSPTKRPTAKPSATIAPIQNTTPTSAPTNRPIPTATIIQTTTTPVAHLKLTILFQGLGIGGDNSNPYAQGNNNPLRVKRKVRLEILNNAGDVVYLKSHTVTYDPTSGSYKGNADVPVAAGKYLIKMKSSQYLRQLVRGIVSLAPGTTTTLPVTTLVVGDVNDDNLINILDYNSILECYAELAPAKNCADQGKKEASDINDDGQVNQFDYNLLLRNLSAQSGD